MLPTECQYPQNKHTTAYTKGCRCEQCQDAKRKRGKAYYYLNLEKQQKQRRDYHRRNSEKIGIQHREYYRLNGEKLRKQQRDYNRLNPEKMIAYQRRRKYGIEPEDYNRLLMLQKGVCAICKRTNKSKRQLAVDHCHVTGKVRGLLCSNCNRGIGFLGDDVERCQQATNYLLRFADG